MSENRQAEQIVWDGPGAVQMSLKPDPDGSLAVEVQNGVVTVTGKQCRHSQGEDARKPKDVAYQILTEVQMTILTTRCQITWKCVAGSEKKPK
jgi:hypothetical protein